MAEATSGGSNNPNPRGFELKHMPHNPDPDYTRPPPEVPAKAREKMLGRLRFLYGDGEAERWMSELERIMRVYYAHKTPEMIELEKNFDPTERFTEKDTILITYGDLLRGKGRSGLKALGNFLKERSGLKDAVSILHILPFFPYSSDRGFSVTDFRAVDPNLGTWQDIEELGTQFRLMFDGVLNHFSSRSPAFQEFLNSHVP